jgi:hypothetical protein
MFGGERIKRLVVFFVMALALFASSAIAEDKIAEMRDGSGIKEAMEASSVFFGANEGYIWVGDQFAYTIGPFTTVSPFDEIPVATNTFDVFKEQSAGADDAVFVINYEDIWADDQIAMAIGSGIASNTVVIEIVQG